MKTKYYTIFVVLGLLILSACGPIDLSEIENQATEGVVPPEAVQNVVEALSQALNEPENAITIVSFEQVDWPDSCLGMSLEGQACAEVITPGYHVVLEVNGIQYEFRSDEDGNLILRESQMDETSTPESTEESTEESTATATETPENPKAISETCYQVTFVGVEENGEGTSSWRYEVLEQPCAQDLGNFVLELPACAQIVDASPSPWEAVHPDPNIKLNGIKWQTGAGFEQGEFMVVLSGDLTTGETQFGTKGPDVAIESIAGPVCAEEEGAPTPTATEVPEEEGEEGEGEYESGEMIEIKENDQMLFLDCEGVEVVVKGNSNNLTFTGTCASLIIQGNDNWISLSSSPTLEIMDYGNNNTIIFP